MVHDVGWTMMDIGKRIERGLALTALLRATLTTVRSPGAEQTVTESTLVACESSVIYRRRNLGTVSVAAVADLVLFDAENPRSLVYQFERLRADLQGAARVVGIVAARSGWSTRSAPGCAGSTRPTSRTSPPTAAAAELDDLLDGHARRPARAVRRHHRDPSVAARRHAAAVGTRRAPGDAVTAMIRDEAERAGPSRCYQVTHRTMYGYSDVVTSSYGRGFLTPRDTARQRCLSHDPA